MKVTIQSITPPTEKELTYPILMEGVYPNESNRKLVVRFTGPTSGIVLYDSANVYTTFKNSEWVNACNKKEWKQFEDKLILEN